MYFCARLVVLLRGKLPAQSMGAGSVMPAGSKARVVAREKLSHAEVFSSSAPRPFRVSE